MVVASKTLGMHPFNHCSQLGSSGTPNNITVIKQWQYNRRQSAAGGSDSQQII